ncbi:MAG TPA: acyltransferase [Microbacterium sp.]|uniref:acyltransferase family protein n=1 Tax=Microbacterium sp. TaxID=51671 RepID=UPI002B46D473|nr:acyltransferase [Microbacterium sp.]HKT57752.1 acyltransferase [Microbacterium sp.]
MRPETRTTATRLAALDGLRGIACLVVLAHHSLLSIPVFADAYYHGADSRASQTVAEYLLTWSPLHLVWEGTGAVWTFFVLSGFVLTRQALDSPRFTWRAYYPQRIIRLYIPVVAAVGLAVALVTLFGDADHGAASSEWIARRADAMNRRGVLHDLTLMLGAGAGISPLWSLQWEVWFSLLLPLFVFAVRARGGATAWLALASAPLAAYAILALGGGTYLAVFLVGAVLAGIRGHAGRPASVIGTSRGAVRALTAAAVLWVVVMLPARWTLWAWRLPGIVTMALSVSAAMVVVLLAMHWGPAQRVLTHRTLLWAGAVSFSLYLVHEPILVASVKLFGDRTFWLALPIAAVVALATAELFRRGIETPAASLARRVGRGVAACHPIQRRREAAETSRQQRSSTVGAAGRVAPRVREVPRPRGAE